VKPRRPIEVVAISLATQVIRESFTPPAKSDNAS
jgi:hypothetical protein